MDIAPELLEKVSGALRKALIADSIIKALLAKNEAGKATYLDGEAYSARVGELLAEAVASQITGSALPDGRMYYNIAEKVLGPSLRSNHDNVTAYCKPIQERMNKEAGLNIKYVKPEFDEDRARGIYAYASRHDDFDSIKSSLGSTLVNFTQHSVDESIKENAEFQAKAGYKAKIVRTAEAGCCEWCADLAGEYEYPDGVSSDTFARHDNCRCTMEYIIGDRAQDVWTKRWREKENEEATRKRKEYEESAIKENDNRKQLLLEAESPFKTPNTPLAISSQDQSKHIVGGEKYNEYTKKHDYPPSYLTITEKEAQKLVDDYHGTGILKLAEDGSIIKSELIIDNDTIVGIAVNNLTGKEADTSCFKIHYSEHGTHIVPAYPSQKDCYKRARDEDEHNWLFRQKS